MPTAQSRHSAALAGDCGGRCLISAPACRISYWCRLRFFGLACACIGLPPGAFGVGLLSSLIVHQLHILDALCLGGPQSACGKQPCTPPLLAGRVGSALMCNPARGKAKQCLPKLAPTKRHTQRDSRRGAHASPNRPHWHAHLFK